MTISDVVSLLRENDNFLLVTHTRPDGDTICSACALCSALRRIGKKAFLFKNPEVTDSYYPLTEPYYSDDFTEPGYVISVDTASVNMLALGFEGEVELCIDHHVSNSGYAKKLLLEADKAACGQIIIKIIEALCGDLTINEAELLYIAISTDTGCFCYANTNSDTLTDAAKLLKLGVDNGKLNKQYFRSSSYARLKLEGLVFSNLQSYRDNKINIAVITREMMEEAGAGEDDCDDLASLAGRVKGSIVAITVREMEGGYSKASVRTGGTVNASAVCAVLGGGGHPMAAGCSAKLPPYELAEKLLRIVNEIWE